MVPTIAAIPSRYEPERLAALVEVVAPDCDFVLVLDNGHERFPRTPWSNVLQVPAAGLGLYRMWNEAVRQARRLEPGRLNLAILNDDVRLHPGTLRVLADALRDTWGLAVVYPDKDVSLERPLPANPTVMARYGDDPSHDMTGFAFMLKAELDLPPFDEEYEWWYGDTAFDEAVKRAGWGVGRVMGVPVEHHSDAEAQGWRRRPELRLAAERDTMRWTARHGGFVHAD